jgi:glycosyltransferase involved in cell wall biosynthesis
MGFDKELVVVNDGSTDSTEDVVRAFAFRLPEVRYFAQVTNEGNGRAVQRAISEAKGDYILIQDADLEYEPNGYLELLARLKSPM